MPDFDAIRAGLQLTPTSPAPTYLDLPAKDRLGDARFLSDVRAYAKDTSGKEFATDAEAVDWFYSNRNWRNLNTVGMAQDLSDAYGFTPEQRDRMRRLEQTFSELPDFWQSGGRGVKAAGDIAIAVIADPLNLIPGGKAFQAGATAAKAGRSAVAAGIKTGAVVDAATNAGVGAIQDVGLQMRDKQLGLQGEYSATQTAISAGAGAILGGAIGGVIGGFAGAGGKKFYDELMGVAARTLDGAPESINRQAILDNISERIAQEGFTSVTGAPRIDSASVRDMAIEAMRKSEADLAAETDKLAAQRVNALNDAQQKQLAEADATDKTAQTAQENAPILERQDVIARATDQLRSTLADLIDPRTGTTAPEFQADFDQINARLAMLETLARFPDYEAAKQAELTKLDISNPDKASQVRQDLAKRRAVWDALGRQTAADVQTDVDVGNLIDTFERTLSGNRDGLDDLSNAAGNKDGQPRNFASPASDSTSLKPGENAAPAATPEAAAQQAATPEVPAAENAAQAQAQAGGEAAQQAPASGVMPLTGEWQDVPEGAILPPGAQIEMNMETGKQRARLAEPSQPSPAQALPPGTTAAETNSAAQGAGAQTEAPKLTKKQARESLIALGVDEREAKRLVKEAASGNGDPSKKLAKVVEQQTQRVSDYNALAEAMGDAGQMANDREVIGALLSAKYDDATAKRLMAVYEKEVSPFLGIEQRAFDDLSEPQQRGMLFDATLYGLKLRMEGVPDEQVTLRVAEMIAAGGRPNAEQAKATVQAEGKRATATPKSDRVQLPPLNEADLKTVNDEVASFRRRLETEGARPGEAKPSPEEITKRVEEKRARLLSDFILRKDRAEKTPVSVAGRIADATPYVGAGRSQEPSGKALKDEGTFRRIFGRFQPGMAVGPQDETGATKMVPKAVSGERQASQIGDWNKGVYRPGPIPAADLTGIEARARFLSQGGAKEIGSIQFEWAGRPTKTADGMPLQQGQVVWYDPRRKKVYSDQMLAMGAKARSQAEAAAPAAAPVAAQQDKAAARAAALDEFARGPRTPEAITQLTNKLREIEANGAQAQTAQPGKAAQPSNQTAKPAAAPNLADAMAAKSDAELKAIMEFGTPDAKAAAQAALTARTAKPEAKAKQADAPAPKQAAQPAPKEPLGEVERVAIMHKTTGALRVAGAWQMRNGPDAAVGYMLGAKGDIGEWSVGKVRISNDSSVPWKDRVETARGSFEAGQAPSGMERKTPEAPAPRTVAEDDVPDLPPSLGDREVANRTVMFEGKNWKLNELYAEIKTLEQLQLSGDFYTIDFDRYKKQVDRLKSMYAVMPEFRLDQQTRENSVRQIADIVAKLENPEATLSGARDFLRRLGGNPNMAPEFRGDESGIAYVPSRALDGTITDRIRINADTLNKHLADPSKNGAMTPPMTVIYHETAHWAWSNILTNADRLEFLEKVGPKLFDGAGQFKRDTYQDLVPRAIGPNEARTEAFFGGRLTGNPSIASAINMGELFANHFEQWMWARGKAPTPDTFWERIYGYFKAVVDRFFNDKNIDPDLEKLFAKVLPDDIAEARVRKPGADPQTDGGKKAISTYEALNKARIDLEQSLNVSRGRHLEVGVSEAIQAMRKAIGEYGSDEYAANLAKIVDDFYDGASAAVNRSTSAADVYFRTKGNDLVDFVHQAHARLVEDFRAAEGGADPRLPIGPFDLLPKWRTNKDGGTGLKSLTDSLYSGFQKLGLFRKEIDELLASDSTDAVKGIADWAGQVRGAQRVNEGTGSVYYMGGYSGFTGGLNKEARAVVSQTAGKVWEIATSVPNMRIGNGDVMSSGTRTIEQAMTELRAMRPEIEDMLNTIDNGLNAKHIRYTGIDMRTGTWASAETKALPTKMGERLTKAREEAISAKRAKAAEAAATEAKVPGEKARVAPKPNTNTAATKPLASMGDGELISAMQGSQRNSAEFREAALELQRRLNSKPMAPGAQSTSPEVMKLGGSELLTKLSDAMANARKDEATKYIDEIVRRGVNRLTRPKTSVVTQAAFREVEHRVGLTEDGLPANMPTAWRDMVGRVTHRDAEPQRAARTMMYRILNMAGQDAAPTYGAIYRAAGVALPPDLDADRVFWNYRDRAFNELRRHLRVISSGLTSGSADNASTIRRLANLATNLMPEADQAIVRQGEDGWFADAAVKYIGEQASRTDALGANIEPMLRGRLETLLDKTTETIAYLTNGVISNPSMKSDFRRITLFGDMLSGKRTGDISHALDAARGARSFDQDMAVTATYDALAGMSQFRRDRMKDMTGGGLGLNMNGGIMPWYRVSSRAKAITSPDTTIRDAADGLYGPGTYLSNSPSAKSFEPKELGKAPTSERKIERIEAIQVEHDNIKASIAEMMKRNDPSMADEIARLNAGKERLAEILEANGVDVGDVAAPMVVRATMPFDTRMSMPTKRINEWLVANDYAPLAAERMTGSQAYDAAINSMEGMDRAAAKGEVRRMLEEIGFDSIVFDDKDGNVGLVVFQGRDGDRVRHIDAPEFDNGTVDLFRQNITADYRVVGDMAIGAVETKGDFRKESTAALSVAADKAGATWRLAGLLNRMLRGGNPTPNDIKTASSASWAVQMSSNGSRARKVGANWIANFFEPQSGTGYFERHASFVGGTVIPLFRKMNEMAGYSGFSRWKDSLKFWGETKQPEEFKRIVSAIRRGDDSKLSDKERVVYQDVRAMFAKMLKLMDGGGVRIGNLGPDYLPQVWSADAILKDPEKFKKALVSYFAKEAKYEGRPINVEDLMKRADDVFRNITDEEGVYMPPRAEKRAAASDHTDYQRMLKLNRKNKAGQLLFPEELDALEGFMENDLQALIAKYVDGVGKRTEFNKEYGVNSHAFHDYMAVAQFGYNAVRELLSSDKIIRTDYKVPSSGGIDIMTRQSVLMRGMPDNEAFATSRKLEDIVAGAVSPDEIYQKAKGYLMELRPEKKGTVWERRAEGIARALADFKGKDDALPAKEMEFLHAFHRASMGRAVSSGYGHDAARATSRLLRNVNSVTLLSFSTLASLPDFGMSLIRSGNMSAWVKGMTQYATDTKYRQAFQDVGVAVENIIFENMARLHGGDGGRASQAFFNAIGLQPWTKMQREMAGAVGFEAFKAEVARMRANFKPDSVSQNRDYRIARKFLEQYGLADYGSTNNRLFDDRLLHPDEGDPRVREALIKFVNQAVFSPNVNDVPMWAQTPWGAMVFQLKSYPMMMARLSKDVFGEAIRFFKGDPEARITPALYMLTVGTGLGTASMVIRDMAQARGGDDPTEPQRAIKERGLNKMLEEFGYDAGLHGPAEQFLGWYLESFMTLGGLGMLGDILYQSAQSLDNGAYGQQRVMSLAFGPSVGLMNDAFNVAAGVASTLNEDDGNAKERQAARTVASRVPIVGGLRDFREGVTNLVAGESDG